jgi:hypothetical protein
MSRGLYRGFYEDAFTSRLWTTARRNTTFNLVIPSVWFTSNVTGDGIIKELIRLEEA